MDEPNPGTDGVPVVPVPHQVMATASFPNVVITQGISATKACMASAITSSIIMQTGMHLMIWCLAQTIAHQHAHAGTL